MPKTHALANDVHGHLLVSWHDSPPILVARKSRLVPTIEAILADFDRANVEKNGCWLEVDMDGVPVKISHSVFRQLPRAPLPEVRLMREILRVIFPF
jgi:hypothetical protein